MIENTFARERQSAEYFVNQDRADDYLVSRAMLRAGIHSQLGVASNDIVFHRTSLGKPIVEIRSLTCQTLDVSVSHSEEIIAVAIGLETRVGIDLEPPLRGGMGGDVASIILPESDYAHYSALPAHEADKFLLLRWTQLESVSKKMGLGLGCLHRNLRISEMPEQDLIWQVIFADPGIPNVSVRSLTILDDVYVSVAIDSSATSTTIGINQLEQQLL